jgi:hypothetical protein
VAIGATCPIEQAVAAVCCGAEGTCTAKGCLSSAHLRFADAGPVPVGVHGRSWELWVPKTYATWADALKGADRFRPLSSGGWKAGQGVG